ncbi:MAG: general secretion pathway protein GspF, partial [Chromatiales bacterium]|nr:general secretion pathway protein GspF [Chromatiales bacterium]
MLRKRKKRSIDDPILHENHKRPVTRRDFIAQGFMAGTGTILGPSIFGMFANPRAAEAALSPDLQALRNSCGIAVQGAGKVPFICIDLAGGANIAGSNVLVGQQGGQMDFLNTGGYAKLGLPGDVVPSVADPVTGATDFINTDLGIAFHSDSAFLRGILDKASPAALANTNGAVIPARS